MSERLDPHFHFTEFKSAVDRVRKRAHATLSDVLPPSKAAWSPNKHDEPTFHYIEIGAVGIGTDSYEVSELPVGEAPSRARLLVRKGDILVSTTRPDRGAIARVKAEHDGYVASTGFAVLRAATPALRDLLFETLQIEAVRLQLRQRSSGGAYPAITADELAKVVIPVAEGPLASRLLARLDSARAERDRRLAQAEGLLAGLDAFVLDSLRLSLPPPTDPARPFAVRLRDLAGGRLDPQSRRPFGAPDNPRRIPFRALGSLLAKPHSLPESGLRNDDLVPYVGLPECDLHELREITQRPLAEVRGRAIGRDGDILFARIEPSVFNRKYVFADRMGERGWAFLSTEFYSVRVDGPESDQRFLYALLLSELIQRQVRGKTTGTSGRRRLDRDMFDSMLVPWPEADERAAIAAEVDRRRAEARLLRTRARSEWESARADFEESLLGPET